ncbi:MAG: beta-lactamase family protein [Rhodothermaceae bacterium]|nr:beta-lactamase family protein [Rhodothermaceae bacterium]
MKSYIVLLLAVILFTIPVSAQDAVVQEVMLPPEGVGFSSDRLDRMHEIAKSYVDEKKIAGVLTMVARKGEVVHFETYGKRDLEKGLDMEHDTIFRIYSMTKPITSVAAMMLYEEGHFRLNDPVHLYIPELENVMVYDEDAPDESKTVKPNKPMTIRHLLSHSSGFTYGIFGNTPVDQMYREAQILNPNSDLQGMVEKLAEIPLMHHPGEKWTYGVSTDVLGHFIEVISGQSLGEFFQERIFDPLNMIDTGFFVPEEKVDRFANNYTYTPDGTLIRQDGGPTSPYLNQERMESGGGGLVSTANDYMRFAQMMLNGGELDGVRLLSPKTVELMIGNHLDSEYVPGRGFGLGFSIVTDLADTQILGSEGTFWWAGLANTYFIIDPKEEMIAMMWTQVFPNGKFDLRDDFHIGVYQAIIESY